MHNSKQLCTFRVGDLQIGVDVNDVQEVIRKQSPTHLPLAPPDVVGLINLRGELVTVIQLQERLGAECRPGTATPVNVIVRGSTGEVTGIEADSVGDVIDIDPRRFEPPPATMTTAADGLIQSVYKVNQEIVLVLNTDALVQVI